MPLVGGKGKLEAGKLLPRCRGGGGKKRKSSLSGETEGKKKKGRHSKVLPSFAAIIRAGKGEGG